MTNSIENQGYHSGVVVAKPHARLVWQGFLESGKGSNRYPDSMQLGSQKQYRQMRHNRPRVAGCRPLFNATEPVRLTRRKR